MDFQITLRNGGETPPGIPKKQHTLICLVHRLLLVLIMVLALTIIGCSNSSMPDTEQATTPETIQTPKSSKTMKFGGSSMEPTLHDGDKVKAFSIYRELNRADMVLFASPESPSITMIKRIVGLPNETIEIKEGHVLINRIIINEPYILEPPSYSFGPTVIPDNSYIVLGDNRNNSKDSHKFGAVPLDNIQYIVEIK